jgi:hypothetical protein
VSALINEDKKCFICDCVASSSVQISQHIKAVHKQLKDKTFSHYDYSTTNKAMLDKQIKTVHDNIRDKKCPSSEYVSASTAHVTCHVKAIHNKIRDQKCPHFDYFRLYSIVASSFEYTHQVGSQ